MFEVQQKAIRDAEDMASAMRTRPVSSASAPNLPGLAGAAVRQAGADSDGRCPTIDSTFVFGMDWTYSNSFYFFA